MNRRPEHAAAITVLEAELRALRAKASDVEAAIATLRGDAPRGTAPVTSDESVPTDTSSPSIAARIEHALRAREWSQRELSRRAGLNVSQAGNVVTALRKGKGVGVGTLRAIADALGVTLAWLTGGAS